ncbi:MAG: isopentenyl phosphate kinase family protein [Euryarchaeota archaeon]|nr:isopentenyl phosphate kinase family protein [Euryarchaeota archaeon]
MPITILKLGGSLLTDKSHPSTPRPRAISLASREIARSPHRGLVLIHGAGSYGHPQVARGQSPAGVHASVRRLTHLLLDALARRGVMAVPVHPMASVVLGKRGPRMDTAPLRGLLRAGMVPVLHGDMVARAQGGFAVLSGDTLARHLALQLGARRVGMATDVPGVVANGGPLARMSPREFQRLDLSSPGGRDVTGGMEGKLRELLHLARHGVPAWVFDGARPGNISRFLRGEGVGTRIVA